MFEVYSWGCLYFDRDIYCIEKYRKMTKITDSVSCFHNITKCVFGIVLFILGIRKGIPESNESVVYTLIIICFAFLVFDMLVLEGIARIKKIDALSLAIEKQWKSEKRVSNEHDHEVNLYKGILRVMRHYPRQIILMGISIIVIHILIK